MRGEGITQVLLLMQAKGMVRYTFSSVNQKCAAKYHSWAKVCSRKYSFSVAAAPISQGKKPEKSVSVLSSSPDTRPYLVFSGRCPSNHSEWVETLAPKVR